MTLARRIGFCLGRGIMAGAIGSLFGAPIVAFAIALWSVLAGQPFNMAGAQAVTLAVGFFSLFLTVPMAAATALVVGAPLAPRVAGQPIRTFGLIVLAALLTGPAFVLLRAWGNREIVPAMAITMPFSLAASLAFCAMLWRARHRLADREGQHA